VDASLGIVFQKWPIQAPMPVPAAPPAASAAMPADGQTTVRAAPIARPVDAADQGVREPGMYLGSGVAACQATMPSAMLTDRRRRSGTSYQAAVTSCAVERARWAAARAMPSDRPV
jgi:hypothetical protein